jgi:hypothetical protein
LIIGCCIDFVLMALFIITDDFSLFSSLPWLAVYCIIIICSNFVLSLLPMKVFTSEQLAPLNIALVSWMKAVVCFLEVQLL